MASLVQLVRHGEVHNPDHVVYGFLPGFDLTPRGARQVQSVAEHLAPRHVVAVITSPLLRARRTAEALAGRLSVEITIDERLTEWRIARRWAGVRWDELPTRFPGELEAYQEHPWDLPFAPESLEGVGERVAQALTDADQQHPAGEIVAVSHQDPIRAGVLVLTGESLRAQRADLPFHAEVITLRPGRPWTVVARWRPDITGGPFPRPD